MGMKPRTRTITTSRLASQLTTMEDQFDRAARASAAGQETLGLPTLAQLVKLLAAWARAQEDLEDAAAARAAVWELPAAGLMATIREDRWLDELCEAAELAAENAGAPTGATAADAEIDDALETVISPVDLVAAFLGEDPAALDASRAEDRQVALEMLTLLVSHNVTFDGPPTAADIAASLAAIGWKRP